jgi:hypothetical protein
MELIRLIKMCLNEVYSKVHIGKHLSRNFPIKKLSRMSGCFIATSFKLYIRIHY